MKFSDEDLQKLLDQNLSKAEIAHKLGVTKETVRYRTNQLKSKQKSIDPEILNLETETDRIDCKSALTLQEQIFLDLHLIEKKAIKDAMIQAGYQKLPDRTIYFRAKKILQKYEAKEGDHRKIMRAMGYGETRILQMLIDSAENAKSEIVRLNARIALAKCLGLQKEVIEGIGGELPSLSKVPRTRANPLSRSCLPCQPCPDLSPTNTHSPADRENLSKSISNREAGPPKFGLFQIGDSFRPRPLGNSTLPFPF